MMKMQGRGLAIALAIAGFAAHPAAAETRSYVVSWFTQAAYSQDGDCPGGINPETEHQFPKDLAALGKTPEEVDALMKDWAVGGPAAEKVVEMLSYRGRIDGKPVNAYTNPAAVTDPNLKTIVGKYAYGFNLDGKGAASPNGFEDPETHEQGVNDQLFRALGCLQTFRGTMANRPTLWSWVWNMMRDSMPAWVITISGDDLSKDGDATITFDRTIEHAAANASGNTRSFATFRVDPDPRSHNSFPAKIKNGVLSLANADGNFRMLEEPLCFPVLELHKTHLRLTLKPDGTLDGIIGGYQPWQSLYFAFGQGGYTVEQSLGFDLPGEYYLLKRMADGEPDPVTGKNTSISAAYRIEAVPAFLAPADAATAKTAQAQ